MIRTYGFDHDNKNNNKNNNNNNNNDKVSNANNNNNKVNIANAFQIVGLVIIEVRNRIRVSCMRRMSSHVRFYLKFHGYIRQKIKLKTKKLNNLKTKILNYLRKKIILII